MGKRAIFEKEAAFIIENRLSMSMKDMARELGISPFAVQRYIKKHGLSPPRSLARKITASKLKGRTTMTPEQDDMLREQLLKIPVKTLARKIGVSDTLLRKRIDQLGLVIPPEIIELRKKESQIQKGSIPSNKGKKMSQALREKVKHTWFKKGNLPHNTLEDGEITIRHEHPDRNNPRPYKYIRLAKNRWEQLQRYNWRKEFGPIPKGHIVVFKDDDTLNCEPWNLELITREENMLRNSCCRNWTDGTARTMALVSKVKKAIKNKK